MSRSLTEQQRAAVEVRGKSVLVSAAAGAGKTLVLVKRLMAYITDPDDPRDIDEFLLITYTRAAAGEMRARILKELRGLLAASPGDSHLKRQLNKLYSAHISTLHAYCMELLREFSAQSALPPDARVADEAELVAVREAVMERTLEHLYDELEAGATPEAGDFGAFMDALGDMKGDAKAAAQIERAALEARAGARDGQWADRALARCGDAEYWERLLLEEALGSAQRWLPRLRAARAAVGCPALEKAYGPALDADLFRLEELLRALQAGWDAAACCLRGYAFDKLGSAAKAEDREQAKRILDVRNAWKDEIGRLSELICCPHSDNVDDLTATSRGLRGLLVAAGRFEAGYQAEKTLRRIADFADIERAALGLLVHEDGSPTEIGRAVCARFREIMVDEYQDINPMQDAIVDALSRDGGNVFYVGDVRQSIYRFQSAEPSIFLGKYERFPDWRENAPGPCRIELSRNFRSDGQVIRAVNHVFGRVMTKAGAEMGYGAPLEAAREPYLPQDRLVELRLTETDKASGDAAVLQEARSVAARVAELVASGEVRAGDCAVLLTSFRSRAPFYHAAFSEFGLRAESEAQDEGYFETTAVRAVTALLEVIRNPRRDVPMLAALRCPALAYTPEELAALRRASDGDLFDCLLADPSPKSAAFRELLSGWRELAPEVPAWRLVSRVLAQSGLPASVDGRGQAELDAYLEVAASDPEQDVPEFLDRLSRREGGVHVACAAGGDAVRLMSVHKSKGLEFPVVAVADLSKRYNLQDCHERLLFHRELGCAIKRRLGAQEYPTVAHNAIRLRIEREKKAEELRVLYVAMTRAEKRLILSGRVCEALNTDFDPAPCEYAAPCASSHMQLVTAAADPERWDISAAPPPLTPQAPADEPAASVPTTARKPVFAYPYAAAADLPSKLTVTGLKGRYADEEALAYTLRPAPDRILTPSELKQGLTAAQRGHAVHLAMQYLNFAACAEPVGVGRELERLRAAGILSPEQHGAVRPEPIAAFFQSALGRRALGAARLWRECKFSMLESAGLLTGAAGADDEEILFQGVVDCFFEEAGQIVLIDFKTDRLSPGEERARAERYRYQLDAYARAVFRMTGLSVAEKHIWFFFTGTDLMI